MRRVALPVILLCIGFSTPAFADQIRSHSKQLRRAADYKVRLSAALQLSKSQDGRAVAALTYALRKDREATVRRVAALGLGSAINEDTPRRLRERALSALERAADRDRSRAVRESAGRSLDRLEHLLQPSAPAAFVQVAVPKDSTRKLPRAARGALHQSLSRTLRRNAPSVEVGSNSRRLPTKAELSRRGLEGFYVRTTVSKLSVRRVGRRTEVSCSVAVRVSGWTGKDGGERMAAGRSASATGNGRVVGASNSAGVAQASRDCVLAVVEEVTSRQVAPFLTRLVAQR